MSIKNAINLEILYKNELSSDVHFLLRTKNGGTCEIPAHKAILASRSTVFERMFWGNLNEGPIVNISDVDAAAFCEFLQFFYLAELDLSVGNIAEVLKLVDKYDVTECFPLCESFLERTVTITVVYLYYELALSFNMARDLVKKFEEMILNAPQCAFQTGPIGGSSQFVLKNILQSDKLKSDEIEIFDGVLSWAMVSLKNKNESITTETIKVELGECLALIRFPIMTDDQFVSCLEKYPNLLEPEVYLDILCFIVNNKPLSIANRFSTVRRGKTNKIDVWFNVLYDYELIICDSNTSLTFRIEKTVHDLVLAGLKIPKLPDDTSCFVRLYENSNIKLSESINLLPEEYCCDPEVKIYNCIFANPILVEINKVYRLDVHLEQAVFRSFEIPTTVCQGDVQFEFGANPSTYISQLNFEEIL